jgi:hypothetical protein
MKLSFINGVVMMGPPLPDAQRDPVVFAGDGFDLIRESACVSELVVSRIASQPAESSKDTKTQESRRQIVVGAGFLCVFVSLWFPAIRYGNSEMQYLGTVLLWAAQDQFRAYRVEWTGVADTSTTMASDRTKP